MRRGRSMRPRVAVLLMRFSLVASDAHSDTYEGRLSCRSPYEILTEVTAEMEAIAEMEKKIEEEEKKEKKEKKEEKEKGEQ